ncbi:MAG: HAMP domain-containing protein, partial [Deltaproteobacteria bacterium]|nr:HAMP domain-containing protein [Deltaproteobacteria bacterium]
KRLHDPIRVSHFIALTIVALLSIFVSTWIAFHLAKGITGPIMDLAKATERISQGDYDFMIEVKPYAGEIETLVNSFNRMTRDLKAGKAELTKKNLELLASNNELDQRRRYMEIILQNVATGVMAADAEGIITTFNRSASEIMHIPSAKALGRRFSEILDENHL